MEGRAEEMEGMRVGEEEEEVGVWFPGRGMPGGCLMRDEARERTGSPGVLVGGELALLFDVAVVLGVPFFTFCINNEYNKIKWEEEK